MERSVKEGMLYLEPSTASSELAERQQQQIKPGLQAAKAAWLLHLHSFPQRFLKITGVIYHNSEADRAPVMVVKLVLHT